jgi:hypothetical protein
MPFPRIDAAGKIARGAYLLKIIAFGAIGMLRSGFQGQDFLEIILVPALHQILKIVFLGRMLSLEHQSVICRSRRTFLRLNGAITVDLVGNVRQNSSQVIINKITGTLCIRRLIVKKNNA